MNKLDFVKSAKRWQRYEKEYYDKAGNYFIELNKSLLTINTFFLGFIGIFLQIKNDSLDINFKKIVLGIAIFCLFISICIGIIYFIKINCFLNNAGDYYEKLSSRLFNYILKKNINYGDQYPKEIYKNIKLNGEVNHWFLIFELIFLGLGFSSIIFYLFSVI